MTVIDRMFQPDHRPAWGVIALLLAMGVVFVGFGNADRVFWRMTAHGGTVPGLVVDVRSYRPPESAHALHVPTVAFRDDAGKIRVMEPARGARRLAFEVDQMVLVEWRAATQTIAVDLPFRRTLVTSIVMSLFTAIGVVAWGGGIWLIFRRARMLGGGMGQVS